MCRSEKVTVKLARNCSYRNYEVYIGEAVEQKEKLCDEVREFAYLVDLVSACGRCEASVNAGTRCGWV